MNEREHLVLNCNKKTRQYNISTSFAQTAVSIKSRHILPLAKKNRFHAKREKYFRL